MKSIVFGMNSEFAVRQFLPEAFSIARQKGFRVVVIAPGLSGPAVEDFPECAGVEYRPIRMRREISPLADLLALWQIWTLLQSIGPLVTNMSTPKMGLLGGIAAWMAGVPHRIYTLRGLRYETTRSWKRRLLVACERIACLTAHRVICISRSVKETVEQDGIAPPGKALLLGEKVSEGVSLRPDRDTARTSELRGRLGVPEEARVIGFVGRLTRDKGITELAESFRLLRQWGHEVYLLLVGEFEPGDAVPSGVTEWLRADPHVLCLGYVADPGPYYEMMDVFVFPTYREGLGRVLLEAAAAGKPVVSTHTTGVVDVVLDGVTGLLTPKGNAGSVARAVACLLADPDLADRMGRSARSLVEQQFDNSIYLSRLGNVLASMGEPEKDSSEFSIKRKARAADC